MKTKKYLLYVCLLGLIALNACHTKKPVTQQKQTTVPASKQINAKWTLEELNGYPIEKAGFDSEVPNIEIQTQNKMYFGYSGCNRINGQLEFTESTIEFKPGPMTRKACIDGGNIETDFMNALMSARSYVIEQNKLKLNNDQGKVVCLFRKTA